MSNPNENEKPRADWGQLAQEALDLWQSHLTSLASDTAAKDEMAQFVAPMSQMFSQWATMMQSGFSGVMPQAWGETANPSPAEGSSTPSTTATPVEPMATEAKEETAATSVINEPEIKAPEASPSPLATAPNKEEESLAPPSNPEPTVERTTDDGKKLTASTVAKSALTQQAARRRATLADGTGDLAQLAGRLAKLERELEALRARPKRSASDDAAMAESTADAEASASSDVGDDERVARSRS